MVSASSFREKISCPSTMTVPLVGRSSPPSMCSSVDLPDVEVVDEMLAILSDRNELIKKKESEQAQARISEIYRFCLLYTSQYILAGFGIQITCRFICQNDSGCCRQSTGDCHTLLLTDRKSVV